MDIPVMPTSGFEVREAHRDSSTPLLPSPASHLYYSPGGKWIVKFWSFLTNRNQLCYILSGLR